MVRSITLIALCLFIACPSFGKSLGVWGTVYPIAEQDFEQLIYQRLEQMQQNGQYAKFKAQFISNVKKHILRPNPVSGLTTTDNPKTYFYDPTFILRRNIPGLNGKIIYRAGTTVNPLDKIKLHEVLFFLNTDDERQILWARDNAKKYDFVKYILVSGNIKDAGKALHNRIYFDQYGIITHKLGIKHIPCIVKQKGKKLKIKEFSLKKYENKS